MASEPPLVFDDTLAAPDGAEEYVALCGTVPTGGLPYQLIKLPLTALELPALPGEKRVERVADPEVLAVSPVIGVVDGLARAGQMQRWSHPPVAEFSRMIQIIGEELLAIVPLLKRRQLIPYLDLAYQGFGDGIAEDAYAIRAIAAAGLPAFVANSFSKSMSVYGERAGALSVVCPDAKQAALVLGQLKFTVRRNYSSPPIHGGQIVARVLTDPELRPLWETELAAMRTRMLAMRQTLHGVLSAKLLERKRQEERAEMDALKGDGGSSWGTQMRNYVLNPYQIVKDLRTTELVAREYDAVKALNHHTGIATTPEGRW